MSTASVAARAARAEVPREQTWDLESLYPDFTAWEADLLGVDTLLGGMSAYRGRLGESAKTLLACLRLRDQIDEVASRVYWFASNSISEDQADPGRQALSDRATAMVARLNVAMAFIEPELLSLPDGTVEDFLESDSDLVLYRLHLTDILAEKQHMLGGEAEEVIASMTELLQAPYDIWRNTTAADMTFEPVLDEHGTLIPMSLSALGALLQSPDRGVRAAAYDSATRAFLAHKRTLTAGFAAAQKRDVILARLRRYPSALAAALAPAHLPEDLFMNLLRVAEQGTASFQRYLEFRRRELGVARLMPHDLQAPLDPGISQESSFAQAFDLVIESLAPLGPNYHAILEQARRERWVDWADNSGKRSGAYSSSCYGYHPVILLNWQGKISDTFTLSHELGHAVHSTLCTRAQPYIYADYTLFLAEMASTTNELLLVRHLLASTTDRALRRYVLTRALNTFTGNFYNGSCVAALQLAVHQMVESGQPLTYENITAANVDLLKRWYGETVEITPEGMGSAWMRAPHHFRNFYYFQYATGIAAAATFSEMILHEGQPAVDRYLHFLSSGSSSHSIDLLREAGIDMTTPAPLERAVAMFDELERELESL